jgi:hypothetical protein
MQYNYTAKDLERFWSKVDKEKSTIFYNGERCWEWTRSVSKFGYGELQWGKDRTKRTHRISWIINCGEIPAGMLVCHHCDNPPCVNPSHLFLGTHQDNATDKTVKGRHYNGDQSGVHNPQAKLNLDLVSEIRRRASLGETQRSIAKDLGMSFQNISRVVNHELWK